MTIVEFLHARITEDERRLDAPEFLEDRTSVRGPGWGSRDNCPICGAYQSDGNEAVTEEAWYEHAERVHQRSRVLAECQAKRAIVELYDIQRSRRAAYRSPRSREIEDEQAALGRRMQEARTRPIEDAVRHLAAVYADHPDYDPTWRVA